jgi:hypothetical protein
MHKSNNVDDEGQFQLPGKGASDRKESPRAITILLVDPSTWNNPPTNASIAISPLTFGSQRGVKIIACRASALWESNPPTARVLPQRPSTIVAARSMQNVPIAPSTNTI